MKPHSIATGVLAAWLLAAAAQAGMYKYVDEDGNVTYSQTPPPSGEYEYIRTPRRSTRPPSSAAAKKREAWRKQIEAGAQAREEDAKVQAEVAKAQELRRKNCEIARKNVEIYTVYRYITDKDGNTVRLDDEERLRRLEEAKQQVKDFCD